MEKLDPKEIEAAMKASGFKRVENGTEALDNAAAPESANVESAAAEAAE
jgi:hypothetical protein